MPSRPDTELDERYEELAALIRAARPHPSEGLRERVRDLARFEPEPKRRPGLRLRRLSLALAPALVVAVVLGVSVAGLRLLDSGGGSADEEAASTLSGQVVGGAEREFAPSLGQPQRDAVTSAEALPPASGRVQRYRAELTVRVRDVDELSSATSSAMRLTRRLGGFVVRADFDTPGDGEGDSLLVVRVPVARIQDAIARFAELGTIVGQRIAIEDLQAGVDRQQRAIDALRSRIARLERELAEPGLTPEARSVLRLQLTEARRQLAARVAGRQSTLRQAATARVSLTLTTREEAVAPPPPSRPGYFERTVRDAAGLLGRGLTWLLAALIVLSPVLVLATVGVLLDRRRRRAADERLLERA